MNVGIGTWQLQTAKARLSELVRDAQKAPQYITVRGQEEAVVLSVHDYEKLEYGSTARDDGKAFKNGSFGEFIENSPLYGTTFEFGEADRVPEAPRDINL
jgi:prevent-host-death family protein